MEVKRQRSENYSYEEKVMLVDLINNYSMIIENKITDAVGQHEKDRTWDLICFKFNTNLNKNANVESLKNLWSNIKRHTRKHFSKLKEETYKTGGGRNKICQDILFDKTHQIIGISVDGLENPNDNDGTFINKNISDVMEEVIALEEENDDPAKDPVFEYLSNTAGEIDKWEKWNLKKLSKPLSQPLSNLVKKVTKTSKPLSSYSHNTETIQNSLLQSKIELTNLMKKELMEKSIIEQKILKKQLEKEQLKVKLLRCQWEYRCNNNNVQIITSTSNSD